MASLPRPLVRRPTTIGAATLLALGLAVLTPITIPLLYLVDLITGSFQGRRVRTYLLITATLWTELVETLRLSSMLRAADTAAAAGGDAATAARTQAARVLPSA